MRRIALISCLVLLGFSTPRAMATPSDAKQLVQSTADQVLARVRTERETLRVDRARLYGLVNELIIPHFDFRRISRWVLGKHWRGATPEQKQRFTEEFQKLLTRTYATVLLEYVDQEIRYLPVKAAPSADKVTVRSEITRPGAGVPIPVNYHMHSKDDAWKVYDISVDGVSLLSTYRSSFGPEVRKYGLDGLISRLEAKEVTNMPATPQ